MNENELTYFDAIKSEEFDILSALYPIDIRRDDVQYYFDETTDVIVEPYINITDLNYSSQSTECIKPKSALEIGIKINF